MIFVHSNVPMCLVGAPHPNKDRPLAVLTRLVRDGERFFADMEVYQEILHRYAAIRQLGAIDAAFASFDATVNDILTFGMSEIRAAKALVESMDGLSARDALHVAVMRLAVINRILSFDRGFDACPGVDRFH